jgi:EmrB/QacA subfamily drug resistance transporter
MPILTEANRKWWTLGAMCFALFMVMLDNTVVNIALPAIRTDFGASISGLSWAVNAYTLSFAVLLVTGGRLGDVFGRKRMFLAGLVAFTLASIGAGLSQSIGQLVFWRAAQGAGAAFLMPGSLSILTDAFHGRERGRALGLWAGISGLALGMGPVLGGLLVEKAGWQWIFFLNVPVALIAVPVTLYAVRESRDPSAVRRIDWPGIATLSLGMGLVVLALVQANDYGWTSSRTLVELAVGAVGLVAFGWLQIAGSDPMVDLGFFRNRTFTAGNIVAFLVTYSMFATFFFITLYMQSILHLSPLETGVRFLPMTVLIILTAPVAGRLSDRFGSRWLLAGGMALVALSLGLESRITDTSGYLTLLPAFLVGGIGMGMTMSPMTAAVMASVDRTKAGAASGVLSMMRMIGGVFGVATLTALFQHLAAGRAAAGHSRSDVFIYSLSHSLRFSAAIAVVGAIVAAAFIRTHHAVEDEAPSEVQPDAALEMAQV